MKKRTANKLYAILLAIVMVGAQMPAVVAAEPDAEPQVADGQNAEPQQVAVKEEPPAEPAAYSNENTITIEDGYIGDIEKPNVPSLGKSDTGNDEGYTRADGKLLVKIASGDNKGMYRLGEAEALNTTTGDYMEMPFTWMATPT